MGRCSLGFLIGGRIERRGMNIARPCPRCGAKPIVEGFHWLCSRCDLQWWDSEECVSGISMIEVYRESCRRYQVEIPDSCLLSLGSKEEA